MALISKPINLSTEANLLYEIYKTLKKINIASGSSGLNIPFEIQITQTSTSAPTILSGSANGLRGATLTTNYITEGEYTIVADLAIFADAKACYKGINNIPFNLIIERDNAWLYAWFWYISDDYTIVLKTSADAFSYAASDGILSSPVLIKSEYNN